MAQNNAFTAEEIAQEVERRREAQRKMDEQYRRSIQSPQQTNTTCIHCGQPFLGYMSSGAEYGFCQNCMDKD
jgi:hypothetical protein